MISLESVVIVLALCLVLSVLSYYFKLLTANGAVASFVVGLLIGVLGAPSWLILLILFSLLGFIVTKFRISLKEELGVQEGKKGERTYRNVFANGFVPLLFAIGAFILGEEYYTVMAVGYIASIAVAASDTVASEVGSLSRKVYLITNGEKVKAGIDGGISLEGTIACIMGGFVSAYLGWSLIFAELWNPLVLILGAIGVIGCMIDSLIGATLERRGIVGKLGTNILSMAAGALIAVIIWML
ncbi:DUF92 domain-containing protein [Candidatus Methanomassiliicoccus intestinalis]|uniref:DUF92 domain-containing protein n=1 Tax=Candidatus Methanomassiliicoccus intestinalis TaxID=1406512 RepID=UPI0037DD9884